MINIEWIISKVNSNDYLFSQHADTLVIITVYIPTPPKFINPYERSK